MTELIQLTGNKSEFSNYVTDPIILKENSRVCLNKASFSIPVIVNREIEFPYSGTGVDFEDTFFKIAINGVENNITYQEFYNAYDTLDLLQSLTVEEFYSGVFPCFVDNITTFKDDDGFFYNIPTFIECVSKASDVKFDYYKFNSESKYEPNTVSDEFFPTNFIVNGTTITQIKNFRRIIEFGLVVQYQPEKVTKSAVSTVEWAAENVNNFTANADGITTADANPAMAVCPNIFDPNGGWIKATPQVNAGKASLGIIFMGKGNDDPLNITGVYQPENFDVGIEFSILGSGERVLQIIDGNETFVYYDSTLNTEVIKTIPNYVPPNQIFSFDHNQDNFYFLVRKGRSMNGTTEFTTTIIQGETTDIDDEANKVIYVAKTTLNTSQIDIKTIAYSLGAGNGFDNWEFIAKTEDSKTEDNYQQTTGDLDGISSANSLILTPFLNNATTWELEDDFWNRIGITQDDGQFNIRSDINDAGWNKKLKWVLPQNINKNYWFGQQYISSILDLSTNPNYISFLRNSSVGFIGDIPREIAVSILDLPIVPNVGSFIGATNNEVFDSGNINKVVNYIQTDKEDLELDNNRSINYVYEAFNLVYRKLNNQQKMPITQLKIKLGFKNFKNNSDQQIKTMEGIVI